MNNNKLLNKLIEDEKKCMKDFYSSGPYWANKNKRAIYQIKKRSIKNFRGQNEGIGKSYTDCIVYDVRNEFNFFGRLVGRLFSFPILKTVYNRQLIITRNHIDNYLKNLSIVYQNNNEVINLLKKYKFDNTTTHGCLKKFEYNKKEYSTHYLQMAHRIEILQKKFDFKKIHTFFEIGGGFGSNIHFLVTNFPNIKKIIYLDVVPNIYVGTEYLKYFYGENVKDYLFTSKLNRISFSNNDDLEIICIPPWQIENLDVEIDHFHNAASFVEMPEKVIQNYCKFIKKFLTKVISLISYDGFNLKTTFDPELLNKFFNNELKIEWKNNLIKERKLVFLTSQ